MELYILERLPWQKKWFQSLDHDCREIQEVYPKGFENLIWLQILSVSLKIPEGLRTFSSAYNFSLSLNVLSDFGVKKGKSS